MTGELGSAPVSETPTPLCRYVIFLNPERTEMLTCWPSVWGMSSWMPQLAARPEVGATWGPPKSLPSFDGDIEAISKYARSIGLTIREFVS